MEIRRAKIDDAENSVELISRSIIELCVSDHKNDKKIISQWLNNKTKDNFIEWLSLPYNLILVATINNVIVGVGSISASGIVGLCYVLPEKRFQKISKSIISSLEKHEIVNNCSHVRLVSTLTARQFYIENGYIEYDGPIFEMGMIGYPMQKII